MNHCYLSILAGNVTNAVCTGSEKLSTWMQAAKFEEEDTLLSQLESNPMLSFDKEFLRWMLSDGAAAMLLSDKPNNDTLSLKIYWIEQKSFANEQPVCMYAGAVMDKTKGFTGWNTVTSAAKTFAELPDTTKTYVSFINKYLGVDIHYISNGPGRDQKYR